ncbi:MAG: tRNA (adenosine(37)-N6)-threonylcarbamoyltransferase complex transferase subunit TsaD [Candidatus Colwellbacteria bacterium]
MGSQNFVKILAIETSCDETAIALVEASGGLRQPSFKILKNVVSSQIKIHRPFGGVVPSLAKREHIKNLPIVLQKTLSTTSHGRERLTTIDRLKNMDLIAVTVGPGLEPALWTGINFAKELAKKHKKPLLGINHLEGHMYSFLISQKAVISKVYPAIVLIVSGGHTILIHQKDLTAWKKIGETRDDAAGEAFDKVARLLGLPYPGGPELEKLAMGGNPSAIEFPRPMIYQKNYDFSFSGLKTAVLYYLRDHPKIKKKDVAASFQQAIIDVLIQKTIRAANEYKVRSVILSGGVASNKALQKRLRAECRKNKLNFLSAERKYQTDNAAMIAVAAYISHLRGRKSRITAQANLNL